MAGIDDAHDSPPARGAPEDVAWPQLRRPNRQAPSRMRAAHTRAVDGQIMKGAAMGCSGSAINSGSAILRS